MIVLLYPQSFTKIPVADPDLELRVGRGEGGRRGGFVLLALPAFLPSDISSFFTQNKWASRAPRAPPLDPPLNTDDENKTNSYLSQPVSRQEFAI